MFVWEVMQTNNHVKPNFSCSYSWGYVGAVTKMLFCVMEMYLFVQLVLRIEYEAVSPRRIHQRKQLIFFVHLIFCIDILSSVLKISNKMLQYLTFL